jgi:hypothetical protein
VVAEVDSPDLATAFAAAGAEFIALGDALWHDPAGAAAAVRNLSMLLR